MNSPSHLSAITRQKLPQLPRRARLVPALSLAVLSLVLMAACGPVSTQPSEPPSPAATESRGEPETPQPTVTPESSIPAGWATHTSQRWNYAISLPPEMEGTDQTPYSQTFGVKLEDLEGGARNFIYISVIDPEIQDMVEQAAYQGEVYNYDPAATEVLLGMQVGDSQAVHAAESMASSFTYQRQPDTLISGQAARTYENLRPWEFPAGTKEIRYYLPLDGVTYLIGGYVDIAGSGQPGAISEDLFHQIIDTLALTP